MNVTKGPMLIAYATLIDEPIDSLMTWVNACVNEGWPGSPATEKERLEHVKKAITDRIDNSITEQIKRSIAEERLAA
jgi:hypothetical protein